MFSHQNNPVNYFKMSLSVCFKLGRGFVQSWTWFHLILIKLFIDLFLFPALNVIVYFNLNSCVHVKRVSNVGKRLLFPHKKLDCEWVEVLICLIFKCQKKNNIRLYVLY